MEKQFAIGVFESLSSGIRLDVYRMLVKAGSAGIVAGRIAAELGLPPANLSFHLKAMTHAGLIVVEQEGRYQRYRADLSLMADLVTYLTEECCGGHPDLCAALPSIARRATARQPAAARKAARKSS